MLFLKHIKIHQYALIIGILIFLLLLSPQATRSDSRGILVLRAQVRPAISVFDVKLLKELSLNEDNEEQYLLSYSLRSNWDDGVELILSDSEGVNLEKVDITTYNAEPNQINSLHDHLGEVIYLYDTAKQQSLHSETQKVFSLKQHPIKELIKRFDEKTGKPNPVESPSK